MLNHRCELFCRAQRTATRHHYLGRSQFWTARHGQVLANKARKSGIAAARKGFNRCAAAVSDGLKRCGANGNHLNRIGRLHGGHDVARKHGTDKSVRAFYSGNFADLCHVQQGRHAGQNVFAKGGGWGKHMAVAACQVHNQRGQVFSQWVSKSSRIGHQHFSHASKGTGRLGSRSAAAPCHQHMHFAADFLGSRDGVKRARFNLGIVVFSNNEDSHSYSTFASFLSLATSSAAFATLMPAVRLAGSATFSVFRRGATSTPRSAGVVFARGFFLAAIMLGSLT